MCNKKKKLEKEHEKNGEKEKKPKKKEKKKEPNPLICESHIFTDCTQCLETHSLYLTKKPNLNMKKGSFQSSNLLQIAPWKFGPWTAI
jgi:hypothetical protein